MRAVVLDQALFEKAKGVENTGRSFPLGVTVVPGGVNFSVFSRNASGFDRENDSRPARVIPIDPAANRTYHYWHVFVPGVQPGQLYAYRVQGPSDPSNGLRFDLAKVLLDPYGRGVVVPKNYSRDAARLEGDNAATAMKSVVVDPHAYDWEDDTLLHRPSLCGRAPLSKGSVLGAGEWKSCRCQSRFAGSSEGCLPRANL